MVGAVQRAVLEEILTEKQINHILKQSIGEDVQWDYKGSEIKPAMDGIAGFLGDHMKAVLYVDVGGEKKKVHLFLKRIPTHNKPKGDFIDKNNYFKREMLMFNVLDEICNYEPNPWCVKAYIYTDSMIVMPDLLVEGYATRHYLDTLDYKHVFATTSSIARLHAAYVNYETQKSIDLKRPFTISQEYDHLLTDPTFCDSPWLTACSKLSMNILKTFSSKTYHNVPDLESKLARLFIEACDSLTEYEDTVNILIHKDLWVNNIMFKYENDVPINALLVDYQCIRYGPPAFDPMIFLYYTTDRQFRLEREKDVLDYYYSIFAKNLTKDSKRRLEEFGYDKESFLTWCERARMFGLVNSIGCSPYVLMDPMTAENTFDNPETYEKHLNDDRSEPVIAHAANCEEYKRRNLEVIEEFLERYVL